MQDMSFLPEDYLEKRAQRRTNLICLSLFVVVMGAVVAAFLVTDKQRLEVRQLQREVDKQFQEAAQRLEQLEKLRERKAAMVAKAKVTAQLIERIQRSVILAELINNMPATLSLLEFEMETKAIAQPKDKAKTALNQAKARTAAPAGKGAAEAPKQTEVVFSMIGVAGTDVQVAQFMASLDSSNLFRDLNLVFSEELKVEDQAMRKFRIELRLNQDIDLKDYEPLMVKRELQQNPMDARVQIDERGKLVSPEDGKRVITTAGDKRTLKD